MSDKIELATGIAKFIVSSSVGMTVAKLVKENVTTTNQTQKVQLAVGAFAVSAMVADHAVDWADDELNELIELVRKFKSRNDETTTEEPSEA